MTKKEMSSLKALRDRINQERIEKQQRMKAESCACELMTFEKKKCGLTHHPQRLRLMNKKRQRNDH